MHISSRKFSVINNKIFQINVSDMPGGVTPPPWSRLKPSCGSDSEFGIFLYLDNQKEESEIVGSENAKTSFPLDSILFNSNQPQIHIIPFWLHETVRNEFGEIVKWILFPILEYKKELKGAKMIIWDI